MKQETTNYLEIVGSIFDTLSESIKKFNKGCMSTKELLGVVVNACQEKPMELALVNEELAENLGLDDSCVGEVIPIPLYQPNLHDSLLSLFNSILEDPKSRCTITGSNSLIPVVIGEAEWNYFLNC